MFVYFNVLLCFTIIFKNISCIVNHKWIYGESNFSMLGLASGYPCNQQIRGLLHTQCSWKVPVLSVLLIKISNVWQKSKSCQSECPIQKFKMFHTEQELVWTENYPVRHDVSFCQTECLTSLKSFQEVCHTVCQACPSNAVRPKQINVEFPLTLPKKLGSVVR